MGITNFVFDDDEVNFVIEEFLDSLDSVEEEGLKQPLVERETIEFSFQDEEDASLGEEDAVWYKASEDEPKEEAEDWEEHLNKEIIFLKEEILMLREQIYSMEKEKKKFAKEWEFSEKKRNEKLKDELAELCSIFIDLDIDCEEVESVNTVAVLEDSEKEALQAGSGKKGPDGELGRERELERKEVDESTLLAYKVAQDIAVVELTPTHKKETQHNGSRSMAEVPSTSQMQPDHTPTQPSHIGS